MRMSEKPLISLIMPVYNPKEEEFRTSVESIINQTFKDFEFIIINDGSTNNAEEIILSYKDPRIKYIKNDQNLKLTKTLNIGLSNAKGQYIARLDSDDYSDTARFQKQVEFLETHSEIGLLGTFATILPTNQKAALITDTKELKPVLRYGQNCLIHSSVMFRKAILDDNNLKYGEYSLHAEDYKLWCEMSYFCNITNLPEYLTYYRLSSDGICATNTLPQQKMTNMIIIDNIIKDFDCNKDFMYSVLYKYTKEQQLTKLEYYAAEELMIKVMKYCKEQTSPQAAKVILSRLTGILKELNSPK